MKVNVSEPTVSKRVLDIEVPVQDVEQEFQKNLSEYQQTAQVRGFRPGKVPRDIVLTRFKDAIMGKTVEDVINHSYETACKEKQLVPVTMAKIEAVDFAEGKPLKFKAEIEIDPPIELKKYTKLGVKVDKVEVKDDDIDKVVEDLLERLATYAKVERASQKGDYIKYEYEKILVGGQPRTDYRNPTYPVPIGQAKIKEFDKALIGASAGDSVPVQFTFPKDYEVEDVRGKDGDFILKITEVLEKKLPVADDDFAKKIGPYQTIQEMRDRIRTDLETRRKQDAKRKAQDELIDKIVDKNEVVVPEARVEEYARRMLEEVKKTYQNATPEEMLERYRKIGEREMKKYKIVDWVAKKENIKATQEEVDARIKEYAESVKEKFEDVKEKMRRNGTTMTLRSDIREEKTLDWLAEQNS